AAPARTTSASTPSRRYPAPTLLRPVRQRQRVPAAANRPAPTRWRSERPASPSSSSLPATSAQEYLEEFFAATRSILLIVLFSPCFPFGSCQIFSGEKLRRRQYSRDHC